MTKIIKFSQFLNRLNEELQKLEPAGAEPIDPEEHFDFHVSKKLLDVLSSLKGEYKVAELLWNMTTGPQRKDLVKDPPDYFDVETDGTISFLKSRYFPEGDVWANRRRQKVAAKKAHREIYNDAYINRYIKETDVAAFSTKWGILYAEKLPDVVELRGKDILRAYNYTEECDKRFGYTCANFFQNKNNWGGHAEPKLNEYDIYVKNPENCGAVVVIENGKIMARRSFQQGIQVQNKGDYKKGEFYTVWGNAYGVGGSGGKYDSLITSYLKKKYNANEMCDYHRGGSFIISLETRFKNYCPFDSMCVCFELNLLSDGCPNINGKRVNWHGTYHAHCPDALVQQRKNEEAAEKFLDRDRDNDRASLLANPLKKAVRAKAVRKPVEAGDKPKRVVYRDKFGRFRKKTS